MRLIEIVDQEVRVDARRNEVLVVQVTSDARDEDDRLPVHRIVAERAREVIRSPLLHRAHLVEAVPHRDRSVEEKMAVLVVDHVILGEVGEDDPVTVPECDHRSVVEGVVEGGAVVDHGGKLDVRPAEAESRANVLMKDVHVIEHIDLIEVGVPDRIAPLDVGRAGVSGLGDVLVENKRERPREAGGHRQRPGVVVVPEGVRDHRVAGASHIGVAKGKRGEARATHRIAGPDITRNVSGHDPVLHLEDRPVSRAHEHPPAT